jgi:hypothetical protein
VLMRRILFTRNFLQDCCFLFQQMGENRRNDSPRVHVWFETTNLLFASPVARHPNNAAGFCANQQFNTCILGFSHIPPQTTTNKITSKLGYDRISYMPPGHDVLGGIFGLVQLEISSDERGWACGPAHRVGGIMLTRLPFCVRVCCVICV